MLMQKYVNHFLGETSWSEVRYLWTRPQRGSDNKKLILMIRVNKW